MMTDLGVRLLPEIYGCAEDMQRWRQVLDQICGTLGVRSAAVQVFRREGARLSQRWCERDSYSSTQAARHDALVNNGDNPRTRHIPARLVLSKVTTDADYLPPRDHEEIQRRLALVGLRGGTGLLVEMSPSYYFSLILHRASDDRPDAEREDARLLVELAPHLHQASRLALQVAAGRQTLDGLSALADRLCLGMILCTREGGVRWCNDAADQLLGQSGILAISGETLSCRRASLLPEWRRLLTANEPGGETAAFAEFGGATVQMMAFPVAAPARSSAGSWAHEDLVALILRDDTQPLSLPPRAIAELFGLTGAEASLAAALCDGASVNQFADKRGISVGTARIHLKRILGKLDSPRQADLVRKLCGSVIAQVRRTQ